MGAGNWYPDVNRGDTSNYQLLYIEADAIYGDDPELSDDDKYQSYQHFEEDVLSCLPKSFIKTNKFIHHNQFVLAENNLFQCILHDNEWSIAIAIIVKEWAPKFAENKLPEIGKLVFDRLHTLYGDFAKGRSGPWTSMPYKTKVGVDYGTTS